MTVVFLFWPHRGKLKAIGKAAAVRNAAAKRHSAAMLVSTCHQRPPAAGPFRRQVILMVSYLVCFRCWPGFSEQFPFEHFDDVSDEELPAALDAYARELLRDSETRAKIKDVGKQRLKDFNTKIKWHSGKDSLPSRRLVRKSLRRERWNRVRRTDRDTPLVCRVGAYFGWWEMGIVGHPLPTQRVWLTEALDRDYVEQLSIELHKRAKLDYPEHQIEYHTNPRFTIVSSDSLTKKELGSARRCISILQAGQAPPVPLAKMALEIGARALQVAQELAESWTSDVEMQLRNIEGESDAKPADEQQIAADERGKDTRDEQDTNQPQGETDGNDAQSTNINQSSSDEETTQTATPEKLPPPNETEIEAKRIEERARSIMSEHGIGPERQVTAVQQSGFILKAWCDGGLTAQKARDKWHKEYPHHRLPGKNKTKQANNVTSRIGQAEKIITRFSKKGEKPL